MLWRVALISIVGLLFLPHQPHPRCELAVRSVRVPVASLLSIKMLSSLRVLVPTCQMRYGKRRQRVCVAQRDAAQGIPLLISSASKCLMPRRAPCVDTSALEAQRAALCASLQEGQRKLRMQEKAARKQRARELAARARTLERAVVILALHESDRTWLPAFLREHHMGGAGDELAAFDEELCSRFLRMLPEEINAIRQPKDQRGKANLRDAQVFITNHQLHAWVSEQNECHGIAPTVGDTLTQRDELAAALHGEADEPTIWSVAKSARYKWAATFRRKWRLGSRKPQAREAVPLEVARKKAQLRWKRV